jgi:uncharacterized protein (TIGR02611 family)
MKGHDKRHGNPPQESTQLRRLIIGVLGFTVLSIGVAMIVLPGPATIVIPLGLGILATEYIWARRLVKKIKGVLKNKTRLPRRWLKRRRR